MATPTSNEALPLPMPEPTVPRKPLSSYKLLSFDIYGTLIDWETGILQHLENLVTRIPHDAPEEIAQYRRRSTTPSNKEKESNSNTPESQRDKTRRLQLASKFNEIEASLQTAYPDLPYSQILEKAYIRLAEDFGILGSATTTTTTTTTTTRSQIYSEASTFGSSISTWPAFPDTVEAMARLRKHYRFLIPLSNVDRASFSGTLSGPLKGVDFFKVYTAQDIGSYKPDLRNFRYLFDQAKADTGVDRDEILHVAQSLFHDHIPAKRVGLASVWINRAGAGMGSAGGVREVHDRGEVGYAWRFGSLGGFADEVERELAVEQEQETK